MHPGPVAPDTQNNQLLQIRDLQIDGVDGPTSRFIGSGEIDEIFTPYDLQYDAEGRLWVADADGETGRIRYWDSLDPEAEPSETVVEVPGSIWSLALDSDAGRLYASVFKDAGVEVDAFTLDGENIGSFELLNTIEVTDEPPDDLHFIHGLAISDAG